jgi:hypothetical protein
MELIFINGKQYTQEDFLKMMKDKYNPETWEEIEYIERMKEVFKVLWELTFSPENTE